MVGTGLGISEASREDGDETVADLLTSFGAGVRDRGGGCLADERRYGGEVGFVG